MAMFRIFFSRVFLLFILYQTSTAVLQCARVFGAYINPTDCFAAIRVFDSRVRSATGSANFARNYLFSRDPSLVDGLRQMRQTFSHRTCAVGIDLIDPLPASGSARSSFLDFRNNAKMLIQRCIYQPGASGGVSKFGNFEITIVNPNDEAVKEIMAMPRALKISFSTAIKTRRLDLQLKADGEAPSSPPQPHDVAHSGMLRPPPTPIRNMGQAAVHPPDERGPIFPHGPDIARGPALTSSQATNMAQPLRQLQLYSAFYPPEQTPNFAHGQPPAFQAPNFAPQPQYGAAQLGRAASFP